VNKIALSADDDKREICDNKIETFAHGHFTTTTTVHDVWTKNRNTHGQTKGPWGTGAKALKECLWRHQLYMIRLTEKMGIFEWWI